MVLQMKCLWVQPDWIERKISSFVFLLNVSGSWMMLPVSGDPGVGQKLNLVIIQTFEVLLIEPLKD